MPDFLKNDIKEILENFDMSVFDKKTVLITGATGLIGKLCVKSLLESGFDVKVIALVRNVQKAKNIFSNNKKLRYIVQDITSKINYKGKVDYIIHCASNTDSQSFVKNPVETINIAINGTKNVLNFAKEKNIKSFIYISSLEVYGQTQNEDIKEDDYGYIDTLTARSSYSEGKRMAETLCVSYGKEYNVPVKIARLSQTFGAGVLANDTRVFAQFAKAVINRENIILHTKGETKRNYCYTTDAIRGIYTVLTKGENNNAYNIANKNTYISIYDLAKMFENNITKVIIKEDNIERGYNPTIKISLNTQKLESLGWRAQVDLGEMIKRLVKSLSANKQIVQVSLINNNLGDSVISDTANYLIKKASNNSEIKIINLFPDNKKIKLVKKIRKKLNKILNPQTNIARFIDFKLWQLFSYRHGNIERYYRKSLKDASCVVFAGGGIIKHSKENFWDAIYSIISYCEKKSIPIYFNAIGIEGFDENNYFSQIIKKYMNYSCVKLVTTRDDFDSLEKYVIDKNKIDIIGDPALWSPETYAEIKKDETSQTIGIGVVRKDIYVDYGFDVQPQEVIDLYVNLIKELNKKGYKWKLFCNGMKSDYKTGLEILEKLNLCEDENYIVKRPTKSKELIKTICSFKAVIAARLHANIISCAYDIPTVGIVWNDKLKLFGNQLGIQDRFIEKTYFKNPDYIVDKLESAIREGYNKDKINQLREKTLSTIEKFLNSREKN